MATSAKKALTPFPKCWEKISGCSPISPIRLSKDLEISTRWRGYEDIADARHLGNRVEREVVDALESAVREAYPRLSHRYYKIKAKWFGLEKLDFWDRNAPLPNDTNRVYSWKEARQTVLGRI